MEKNDIDEDTINLKVVILGEVGVGKSSIINQFISKSFSENLRSNISGQYCQKLYNLENGKTLQFDIWDTAGQEKYRSLVKMFYKDAIAAILVYDITRQETFDELKIFWSKEITQECPNIILVEVANKADLIEEEKVDQNEAKKLAEELNAIFCISSAKFNTNIDEIFFGIAKKYFKNDDLKLIERESNDKLNDSDIKSFNSKKLSKKINKEKKAKSKCC